MSGFPFWLKRGRLAVLWLVCGAALACAQDARLEVPRVDQEARLISVPVQRPAQRHEVLQAQVELFGLPLGSLESSICSSAEETTIRTRVEPAALVQALRRSGGDAHTELAAFEPRASEYHIQDGELLRHYRVEHRAGQFEYQYDNGGEARRSGQAEVPEGAFAHDLQSALVLLRGWRPRLGEVGYFYVVLGRRLWRVDVTHVGPQVIRVHGAPRLAHRLDGISFRLWQPSGVEPRRFSLWLSEDPDRVPLRMVADASFGEVALTLTAQRQDAEACRRTRAEATSVRD